jgi:ketosteroid isomerase-like protein
MTGSDELTQHKAAVRNFFELMNAGDVDGAFALLTPDVTWFSLSTRKFSSREAIKASIEWVNSAALRKPIQQTITVLTAEDNRVAALNEGHAETITGVRYDQAYHFLFEFTDGLISRIWEFNDTYHSRAVFALDENGKLPKPTTT